MIINHITYILKYFVAEGPLHVDYFQYLDGDKNGKLTIEEVGTKLDFLCNLSSYKFPSNCIFLVLSIFWRACLLSCFFLHLLWVNALIQG